MEKARERMVLISFHVPQTYVELIDEFVKLGYFPNRSEAIRTALKEFLEKFKSG